jgi:cell wall-associated NlpC family hydrolase
MHLIGRLLIVIMACVTSACAARGGVPRPFPGAPLPPDAREEGAVKGGDNGREIVVATALGYRGVPYRNGGSDPAGFDCSGFVQYVFKQAGTVLPREVREQFQIGEAIDRGDVRAGDLVFFETVARGASHVGLAIGGGEFVHAPSSNGVVRIERMTSSYWARRYVGARRVR